jgi:NADPH-dependent 2,4-dienoyl-CoA reductase/sulfur reductase-like enzyme/rhodanese-related sulfurtransferase
MNEAAEIIVVEKDEHVSFANCGLPYYIGGEITERKKLLVADANMLRKRFRIDIRERTEAMSIDRTRKVVRVQNHLTGEHYDLSYDKLILAPGATPIVPEFARQASKNVFTLRNMADTDRIKAYVDGQLARGQFNAVIVGAGFIGLEMAEQLRRRGANVSVVELQPQVLPLLDQEMAHVAEVELRSHEISLHLGSPLESIQYDGDVATQVTLAAGKQLPVDLLLFGIGVVPGTKLAVDAGLSLGKTGGITTNAFGQTSDPDIYAVGDAAEYVYAPTSQPMRVPLAGPANRSGRIAGEHAATDRSLAMAPVLGTSIVRIFDLAIAMTGLTEKLAKKFNIEATSVLISANHHAGYFPGARQLILKLIFSPTTRRVLGAQAIGAEGADKRIDIIATLISLQGTVDQLADLDLCYAPPFGSAKDPLHMAAFAAVNHLNAVVRFCPTSSNLAGRQVIDVRTPAEVSTGILPGAIHIPLDELRARIHELDRLKPTTVICASGLRSYIAARILIQSGFTDVCSLTGGMMMRRHSLPLETLATKG